MLPWVLSWVNHALTTAPRTLFDANVAYPARGQLTGVPHLLSLQIIVTPLRSLGASPILAANVAALATYPLAAFAMQRLLQALGFSLGVSFLCGLWYALGSFRVPFNLNQLQFANLFLPWVALTLTRLRDHPDVRRAAALLTAFGLGAFSSFYAAVLVGLMAAIWGLFELRREAPARMRFVVLSVGVAAIVGILLFVFAGPYLVRMSDQGEPRAFAIPWRMPLFLPVWVWAVLTLHAISIGVAPRPIVLDVILLASVAVAWVGWRRGEAVARRTVPVGLVLWLGGAILAWGYPPLIRSVAAVTPLGLLRYLPRYLVIGDFGLVLLLAVALGSVGARWGRAASRGVLAVVALLLLVFRGGAFSDVPLKSIPAYAGSRDVYDRVATIWRGGGKGALLELPILGREPGEEKPRTLEPDAILASTLYWWPTPAAHVSYHAPHRWFFMRTVDALPAPWALEELVDLTDVRWILVRPPAYWVDPERRDGVIDVLRDGPVPTEHWSLSKGWELFRIDRRSRRPKWLHAVRSGDVDRKTLLGTPMVPIPEDEAIGVVHVEPASPSQPVTGRIGHFRLEVTNTGTASWPVAVASTIPITLGGRWGTVRPLDDTVIAVARWRPAVAGTGSEKTLPAPQQKRLRRDVEPGETIGQRLDLFLPTEPGWYDLEVALEQVGGAEFSAPGNRKGHLRVRVEP